MQSVKSLEKQIVVLEKKLVNMTVDGKITKGGFAVAGKLKQLNTRLTQLKNEQWLAK